MVRCAAAIVCLLAVLACASVADAQYFGRNKVHYDRLDFRVLQTEHFEIYYYAEEQEATRHAARMAERWYARFSQILKHTFAQRQPLVLYASHPHFAQTNVTPAALGEGTGGLTERTKTRIAMPFAAGLGATDHVLGHEIAHAFQIDIVRRAGRDAFALPGWFIEGMAEYLSLGPDDSHTAMWLRDAAVHDQLPTLDDLAKPRFFPYRYGHGLWSFLTSRYGDDLLARVLRSKARGALQRIETATGVDRDALTKAWHESVMSDERPAPAEPPRRIPGLADGGRLHVAPALSPGGTQVVFISERDRLSLDLFLADAKTGGGLRKLVSTAADPHFDSLQYIRSSGAWDGAGSHLAMAALSAGRPVLVIVDVARPSERTEIAFDDFGEIYNPSWSPDGTRIVFSALKNGFSDLFVYTVETGAVQQLTADPFAELHPAWSPDGRSIAVATDRFTSRLDDLAFGPLRIGLLDLETGVVRPLLADGNRAKQMSPQWSPMGDALYFVSDRDGVNNVYRVSLASGELRRVTDVVGGVSGITATSPALAVASKAGTLAFSVYSNGRYDIALMDAAETASAPVVETDPVMPEAPAPPGTLARLLADPQMGLPDVPSVGSLLYDDRLRLESVAPPFIGASTGMGFGGVLRASIGVSFADMLRDRQLQMIGRVGTDADDFAMQVAYTNRRGRWNWGGGGGFVPARFVGARRAIARVQELVTRETSHLRYDHQWGRLLAHYHLNRVQRFEFGAGVRRTGFEWQTITRVIDPSERRTVSRSLDESVGERPILMGEADAAFVHDTAVLGPTSPVLGKRLRLEVEPAFGGLMFADARIDARRYFMPVRPVTIAVRAEHVGRYGPDAGDHRLTPLVVALQSRVRGYDLRTFAADECGRSATTCSPLDELTGGRLALLNVEVRAPLVGLLSGDLYYGRLPIEAFAFVDAGYLWTRRADAPLEQDRFRSVGAGGRVNIGGFILELAAARPFDRVGKGWTASLLLRPGF
jgi:Tol biopolymer transport system component